MPLPKLIAIRIALAMEHTGHTWAGYFAERRKTNRRRLFSDIRLIWFATRFYDFLDKYYYLTPIVAGVALFAIGGWTMVLWGIFTRTILGWHATWLVNSATHLWGKRRFETRDDSRNNGFIAAITYGEGWHNNHHAYPRSARHGLTWKEIDPNWIQIRILEKLGLVKDVYAYDLERTRTYTHAS